LVVSLPASFAIIAGSSWKTDLWLKCINLFKLEEELRRNAKKEICFSLPCSRQLPLFLLCNGVKAFVGLYVWRGLCVLAVLADIELRLIRSVSLSERG
jgi:hypothetical protein